MKNQNLDTSLLFLKPIETIFQAFKFIVIGVPRLDSFKVITLELKSWPSCTSKVPLKQCRIVVYLAGLDSIL